MARGVHTGLCGLVREGPDGWLGDLGECGKDLVDIEPHACACLKGFNGGFYPVVNEVVGSVCIVYCLGVKFY